MRKSLIAFVAAGGLAIAGTGLATAGEESPAQNGSGTTVQTKAAGQAAAPQVTNAAQAADLVLREVGGGRVTGVGLSEENGRAVWKVVFVDGAGQRGAQVDALTQVVQETAADPALAADSGSGVLDDDTACEDDADADGVGDIDDDDDDDDDGGERQGVEGNK